MVIAGRQRFCAGLAGKNIFKKRLAMELAKATPMPAKDADERATVAILPEENADLWRQAIQKA